MIEITGTHEHGMNITGWDDKATQLRVWWRGTDDDPGQPNPHWVEYMAVITNERAALNAVADVERYINLELISAELEPRGRILACPVCDKVLEIRDALPRCPRCGPIVRGELERAATVNRVTQGLMDTMDKAVTDGLLPG